MTTWRERIAEARQRGGFTAADREDIWLYSTCFVGEQAKAMPDVVLLTEGSTPFSQGVKGSPIPVDEILWTLGGHAAPTVRISNDPDAAERLLDAIEDRALELKRAHGTDAA
jgi:hypothetical protein